MFSDSYVPQVGERWLPIRFAAVADFCRRLHTHEPEKSKLWTCAGIFPPQLSFSSAGPSPQTKTLLAHLSRKVKRSDKQTDSSRRALHDNPNFKRTTQRTHSRAYALSTQNFFLDAAENGPFRVASSVPRLSRPASGRGKGALDATRGDTRIPPEAAGKTHNGV